MEIVSIHWFRWQPSQVHVSVYLANFDFFQSCPQDSSTKGFMCTRGEARSFWVMGGPCLYVHYQQSILLPRLGVVVSAQFTLPLTGWWWRRAVCCVLWAGSTDVLLNFWSWSDDNTTTEWIELALLSSYFVLLLEFRVRRGKTMVRMKGCVNFAWLWHGWVQCFSSCSLLRLASFRFGDYFCISAKKN